MRLTGPPLRYQTPASTVFLARETRHTITSPPPTPSAPKHPPPQQLAVYRSVLKSPAITQLLYCGGGSDEGVLPAITVLKKVRWCVACSCAVEAGPRIITATMDAAGVTNPKAHSTDPPDNERLSTLSTALQPPPPAVNSCAGRWTNLSFDSSRRSAVRRSSGGGSSTQRCTQPTHRRNQRRTDSSVGGERRGIGEAAVLGGAVGACAEQWVPCCGGVDQHRHIGSDRQHAVPATGVRVEFRWSGVEGGWLTGRAQLVLF